MMATYKTCCSQFLDYSFTLGAEGGGGGGGGGGRERERERTINVLISTEGLATMRPKTRLSGLGSEGSFHISSTGSFIYTTTETG